jgi:hypothetical protein
MVFAVAAAAVAAAPAAAHDGPAGPDTEWGRMAAPFAIAPEEPPAGGAAVGGSFSDPFEEPTLAGQSTDADCTEIEGQEVCKPAGASVNVLNDGRILYWNALEGMENVNFSVVNEYGAQAINDQSRVLDLDGPTWTQPAPVDGGANETDPETILPDALIGGDDNDNGALFCSDQVLLPGGRVLAAGGTDYYLEPGLGGLPYGVSELEGLKKTRIFDPKTNSWSQSGDMKYGRWYPTLVQLASGKVLAASGVSKLAKPVYPERPLDSGTNVTQTETYDPATGKWADNGTSAKKSLPLFPRLHLLPNGHVFYNAAGQAFNPFGQAYDEPLWSMASVYDPAAKSWRDLGVPGLGTTAPGFRGSTASTLLTLKPPYKKAEFLTAGGVLFPTPGSYFPTDASAITTIDTSTAAETMTTEATGSLNRPRWYSTSVLLPTGQVAAFSGADRDGVDAPGVELPIKQAELFDPATKTWSNLAVAHKPRTYHNTAVLLPDGRILVGGHAPIATMYVRQENVPGFAPNRRDPSFEIYSPPYLFKGERPRFVTAPKTIGYGTGSFTATTSGSVDRVVLTRNTALTHLVDANQRAVELPFTQTGAALSVKKPPSANVAPAGPYLLWVIRNGVPSVARQVEIG